MQKLVLLFVIMCALYACSQEACDMTGQRYTKMIWEGTPLTERDKACAQAVMLKGLKASQEQSKADLEKQQADLKAQPLKPIDWNQTLFSNKQGTNGR